MDILGCEDDSFESGGADFVYGDGFDRRRESGENGGLAGGRLTDRGLKNVAHVDVCDLGDWNLGLFEGGFDGYSAEMRCGDGGEGAIELILTVRAFLCIDMEK